MRRPALARALIALVTLLTSSSVIAQQLVERFDEPFADWRLRWLPEVCNLANYYVPFTNGPESRGNNPTGIWIPDGDPGGDTIRIGFDREFGESLAGIELDASCWVQSEFFVVDLNGDEIYSAPCTDNLSLPVREYPHHYEVESQTGIWTWGFRGGLLEGNTAIDNIVLTLRDEP